MKILLKHFNEEVYVWKNAEMGERGLFVVEGNEVNYDNIVSVSRDNRKKFVRCSACGEIIKKSDIDKHKAKGSASATCFGCQYMRENGSKQLSVKYSLQEDGSYIGTVKKNVKLMCNQSYYHRYDINSQDARDHCRYKNCATAEMSKIEDIFTKYPGVFDDIITVDSVLDAGFKDRREYGNRVHYTLKARNNIVAVVNKMNIVEYFNVSYRNETWKVMYSKKYNMLFRMNGGTYRKFECPYGMPTDTFSRIKEKIASLYN